VELAGKRLLVIGGGGLIGSHIVDQLTKTAAKEIVVFDNFCRGSPANLAEALKDPRVSIFPDGGDMLHRDILDRAMRGADGVFLLAAVWLLQCHEYPETAFDVNVRGTFEVIMAAIRNKVQRVVYSSSASVYGDAVETPMSEDHPYNNFTFYGATKIAGEHFFKSLGARYGLPWVGLRYMNVYGPRQDYKGAYIAVMHKVLDRIESGQRPIVFGDGSQKYDFIHVADVARANILAMEATASGENYNVGRGVGTTIKELTELLLRLKQSPLAIQYERRADLRHQPHRLPEEGPARPRLRVVHRPRGGDAEPHRLAAPRPGPLMCGVAGIAALGPAALRPEAIKAMADAIRHRGPDDAGYAYFSSGGTERAYWTQFSDPQFAHQNENLPVYGGAFFTDETAKLRFSLALGHRRLSIIDLSHYGHQPMPSVSRRFWVSYNGEIYNHRELRAELEARGHVFRTHSDTEVLLNLWEEHGEESLARLDGMFAFALFDTRSNRLVLARDRFGVKPLYYAQTGAHLVFASEIKAILASGHVEPRLHPRALAEYLCFQNVYSDETLFEGVRILEPGHLLELRPGSAEVSAPRSYLPPLPSVDVSIDADSAAEQVAALFGEAVKRQLVSDVQVGSYLSGGMDSGSIVAVAGRSIPRLHTFTGGFDLTNVNGIEQGFDERAVAERLSYLLQTEHYAVVLHAGDMPAAMERISWHMDDPRVGMCHQNWYVAKLASKFVKVCLAGAGGDELFGGYPWRYRPAFEAESVAAFDRAYFHYWHRLLGPAELPGLLVPELRSELGGRLASYERIMAGAPAPQPELTTAENLLQRALYFEYRTFLHGFLVTEDHISMAHGLETRVPFLDNALADLSWRLSPRLKVDTSGLPEKGANGHLHSADGKLVLRRAMEAYLPAEFTRQKKQGFSPPDENWFRGPSMDYIRAILSDDRARQRPWFDQSFVEARLEEHFRGQRNHRLLIWSLLSIEWLQRHFIDR